MIINNVVKAGGTGNMLRFVLRLRAEKAITDETFNVAAEFVRHLLPAPPQKAAPETVAGILRLVSPEMQRLMVKSIMSCDRIRKEEAMALGKGAAAALDLKDLATETTTSAGTAQLDPQTAWARIKDLIARRGEPAAIAAAVRVRLNAKYDAEEIRQSRGQARSVHDRRGRRPQTAVRRRQFRWRGRRHVGGVAGRLVRGEDYSPSLAPGPC